MNPSFVRKKFTEIEHYKGKAKYSKMQTRRFQSAKNLEEEKILNVESGYELFISVSEAFESALNQLEIKSNLEKVYNKLIKIENLIKTKISNLNTVITAGTNIPENAFVNRESVVLANLSLSSTSTSYSYLKDDESFEDFVKKVTCPFCAKPLSDKYSLVKHLDKQCSALMCSKFEKKEHIDYCVFQILSNNTFKCNVCPNSVHKNIKHYFLHTKNDFHISKLRYEALKKNFSEFLFCASCKVQVPNNSTQLNIHLKSKAHIKNSKINDNLKILKKKNIYCIYKTNKTFKCLVCNSAYKTFNEIQNHFKKAEHTSFANKKFAQVMYCAVCSKEVHFFNATSHIFTSEHKINENKYLERSSCELCIFCAFECVSLVELSQHVKSDCNMFNNLKEEAIKLENLSKQDDKEEKIQEEIFTKENDSKGNYIIVKGYENIPELLKYFKKFGKIEAIENYNEEDVLIKFSEKSSLEDVLLLRSMHKINGETIQIAAEENIKKKKLESLIKVEENKTDSEASDSEVSFIEEISNNKNEDTDFGIEDKHSEDKAGLVNLFERVAEHLMNYRQSSYSATMLKIAVLETVKTGHCSVVGFLACKLSFPSESVSLHLHLEELCELVPDGVGCAMEDEFVFNDDVLLLSYQKMLSSDRWKNVILVKSEFYIPHIKCIHTGTNKSCTLTFMWSSKILSIMLSDCVKTSKLIRRFCMLIRFWVSVQKLKIKDFDYALISLLVYFFKSKNFVNKSFESYKKGTRAALLGKAISAEELSSLQSSSSEHNSKSFNLKELFQEFLEFLHTFNFEKYAICLPLDFPVPRTFFTKENSSEIFSKFSDPDKLNDSPMCIMDPFLCVNLASGINKSDMATFLIIVSDLVKKKNYIPIND